MKANKIIAGVLIILAVSTAAPQFVGHVFGQQASQPQLGGQVKAVNINKASAEDLEAVRGIGPSLAQRIVDYREAYGKFEDLDELLEVRGIGDAKLKGFKDQIVL
jgi:comEA protein